VPAVLVKRQPAPAALPTDTSGRRSRSPAGSPAPTTRLRHAFLVNRVWQYHFGEGLVRTPSDFGIMGQAPTHPELLDWLASWFVEQGWSVKKLHRLILSSNAYRMSKRWHKEYAAVDPENQLLWHLSGCAG